MQEVIVRPYVEFFRIINETFNIANSAAPQRWLITTIDAETTGIQSVTQHEQSVKDILQNRSAGTFTLDGRRMPDNNGLRPGLYIINGRKTVIK